METKRIRALISGRVQGVCFRFFAQEEANRLSVSGWVRNLDDGRVELLAEGPVERVDELLRWCHRGPPSGRVDGVEVAVEEPTGESGTFAIRR